MGLLGYERHFGRAQWRGFSRILGLAKILRAEIAIKVKTYRRAISDAIEATLW